MTPRFYIKSGLLFVVIAFVAANKNYVDYEEEVPEKSSVEDMQAFFRRLLQRGAFRNTEFEEIPSGPVMIRKSQRSPSLRLRFGRSDPRLGLGSRPFNAIMSSRFDD